MAGATAAALVVVALAASHHGGQPQDKLSVRPTSAADFSMVDLADIQVTVQVTNQGTTPVTPTCDVVAADTTGNHHGAGTYTLRAPLEPGQTVTFSARLPISGQGAGSVTHATASCHGRP